jgi:hypothetical protein
MGWWVVAARVLGSSCRDGWVGSLGWVEAPGYLPAARGPASFIIRNRLSGLRKKPVRVLKERRIKIEFPGSGW